MNQRIFILTNDNESDLNDMLDDGWKVVQMCPMPSASGGGGETYHIAEVRPTCAVLLERKG